MNRDAAIFILKQVMPEVKRDFFVRSLSIFGSVARGETSGCSDVDLLVSFDSEATITLNTLASLHEKLEERLRCKVDLIEDHPRLRPSFRRAIQKDLLRVA